jgi:hypothetical protein
MKFQTDFTPPRRKGYILYAGFTMVLLGLSGYLLIFTLDQQSSGFFALALLGAVVAFIPIPFILYAIYALLRAKYILDREGLKIRWGLRGVDIPMPEIERVQMAIENPAALPTPAWSFTGMMRGVRHSPDLGEVEFLASDKNRLVLVSTSSKVFAISPENPIDFLKAFQSAFELGSITPLKPISNQAGTFFSAVFANRRTRALIILETLLVLALLVTVAWIIPSRPTITLGYQPGGLPISPSPSDRLLLLPVLSVFALAADLSLGFFLFRRAQTRDVAYLIIASGLIPPVLFFLSLFFLK